jgi:hypothetical protein
MRQNLTVIADGVLVDQVELVAEYPQNSILHLALLPDHIAIAMQWEGDAAEPVPLLGLWQAGQAAQLCPAANISGVGAMGAGFVVTDGQGVARQRDQGLALLEQHPVAWGNHPIAP